MVILVVVFIIAFAMTIGPITWLYLAEIMTEKGMGIAVSLNWLVVIFISYLPSLAKDIHDEHGNSQEKDLSIFFF